MMEKEMATHSNVFAWRIPWMEESGGLPSMGSHRVGHNWSDLAAAAANFIKKGETEILHEIWVNWRPTYWNPQFTGICTPSAFK